jgi:hypothetical protein
VSSRELPDVPRNPGTAVGPASTGTEPRSSHQIREDIQRQRQQLGTSVDALRVRVNELTDWRAQAEAHREQLIAGAAAVGFVVGVRFMLKRRRNR